MFASTCKPTPIPGIYQHRSGEMIRRTVHDVVRSLHPEQPIRQPNGTIRRAFARMARQRAAGEPVALVERSADPIGATIAALASWGSWEALEIIAAPLHLTDHRLRVATTADLLIRHPDGSLGIALLATEPMPQTVPLPWLTHLGAALVMASDQLRTLIPRPFVIWATPFGVVTSEHNADDCTVPWVTGLETVLWLDALRNGGAGFSKAAPMA